MTILVAGVGNVFLRDDGFGVEVARRLIDRGPTDATVVDYGTRGLHLAFALLDPVSLLVVVDTVERRGAPGTLYLIDPSTESLAPRATPDAHGMDLGAVFAMARTMGASLPPTRIVGCQPARVDEAMGLTPRVAAAVEPAVDMVCRLITEENES